MLVRQNTRFLRNLVSGSRTLGGRTWKKLYSSEKIYELPGICPFVVRFGIYISGIDITEGSLPLYNLFGTILVPIILLILIGKYELQECSWWHFIASARTGWNFARTPLRYDSHKPIFHKIYPSLVNWHANTKHLNLCRSLLAKSSLLCIPRHLNLAKYSELDYEELSKTSRMKKQFEFNW